MKTIKVKNTCDDFNSYRAARVKSMFNVESGCNFDLTAELPMDMGDWSIGVIVGPSGSGKTSLGKKIWSGISVGKLGMGWPKDRPIIDAIAPDGKFDEVTGALSAVGLGNVSAWLRPYRVLSCGEQFRASLARIIVSPPERIVIDEFTSVIDRQIARIGAMAFAKSWRRAAKKSPCQVVLLSCHYDILEWIEADWVFDTATGHFTGRYLRRPKINLDIWKTDWRYWKFFEPHHYLKLPLMIAAKCYVGTVGGAPVCHVAMSCKNKGKDVEARGCRLVVMPEWQGAGVGLKFLNQVCQWNLEGAPEGRLPDRPVTTIFHTSHPGLCAALRRDRRWRQVSAHLYGGRKKQSAKTMGKTSRNRPACGYGGHFRAIQGFRYVGAAGL